MRNYLTQSLATIPLQFSVKVYPVEVLKLDHVPNLVVNVNTFMKFDRYTFCYRPMDGKIFHCILDSVYNNFLTVIYSIINCTQKELKTSWTKISYKPASTNDMCP